MGSAQSYVTPENAITAAVVVASAVGLGLTQRQNTNEEHTKGSKEKDGGAATTATAAVAGSGQQEGKKKKRKTGTPSSSTLLQAPGQIALSASQTSIPGEFEPQSMTELLHPPEPEQKVAANSKKSKKKGVSGTSTPAIVEPPAVVIPKSTPPVAVAPSAAPSTHQEALSSKVGPAPTTDNDTPTSLKSSSKKTKKKANKSAPAASTTADSTNSTNTGTTGTTVIAPTTTTAVAAPVPTPPSVGQSTSVRTDSSSAGPSRSSQPKPNQPSSIASSSSPVELTRPLHQSTASIDTDGSWTRVESRSKRTGSTTPISGANENSNETAPAAAVVGAAVVGADEGASRSKKNNNNNSKKVTPVVATGTIGRARSGFSVLSDEDVGAESSSTDEDGGKEEGLAFHARGGDNQGRKKTLAEKMLPKPRKTGVEDMLETPDHPTVARVMRVVQPGASSSDKQTSQRPADGFSWADYEDAGMSGGTSGGDLDADGEDDGWGVVKSRKSKPNRTSTLSQSQVSSSSTATQSLAESQELSKKQRQNLKRREASKALQAEAESVRLATLAKHQKELDRARSVEQHQQQLLSARREAKKAGGAKQTLGGGMKAAVDEQGKLVWE